MNFSWPYTSVSSLTTLGWFAARKWERSRQLIFGVSSVFLQITTTGFIENQSSFRIIGPGCSQCCGVDKSYYSFFKHESSFFSQSWVKGGMGKREHVINRLDGLKHAGRWGWAGRTTRSLVRGSAAEAIHRRRVLHPDVSLFQTGGKIYLWAIARYDPLRFPNCTPKKHSPFTGPVKETTHLSG